MDRGSLQASAETAGATAALHVSRDQRPNPGQVTNENIILCSYVNDIPYITPPVCVYSTIFPVCVAFPGLFLWDHIKMPVISLKSEVMQSMLHGLVALMNETPVSKTHIVPVNYTALY